MLSWKFLSSAILDLIRFYLNHPFLSVWLDIDISYYGNEVLIIKHIYTEIRTITTSTHNVHQFINEGAVGTVRRLSHTLQGELISNKDGLQISTLLCYGYITPRSFVRRCKGEKRKRHQPMPDLDTHIDGCAITK